MFLKGMLNVTVINQLDLLALQRLVECQKICSRAVFLNLGPLGPDLHILLCCCYSNNVQGRGNARPGLRNPALAFSTSCF